MNLVALTSKKEIRHAYTRFAANLRKGAVNHADTKVGYQGGGSVHEAHWRPVQRFWAVFEDSLAHNRYWCAFGTTDPGESDNLSITCEVNIPFDGIDRRIAGVFVKNDDGTVFVAHSGKIGGGRKGVGKSGFWRMYRGAGPTTVTYSDGAEREVVVIGRIDSPLLAAKVGHFVHEVARIKDAVSAGSSSPSEASGGDEDGVGSYTPEFAGARTPYPFGGVVESTCRHGLVVDALARRLTQKGHAIGNDRARDLFVVDDAGSVTCLFEVKTDLSTTSTYAAIGQVMFDTALDAPKPLLVVVFPGLPTPKTAKRFRQLGIQCLTYEWQDEKVTFTGLKRVLGKIDGAAS